MKWIRGTDCCRAEVQLRGEADKNSPHAAKRQKEKVWSICSFSLEWLFHPEAAEGDVFTTLTNIHSNSSQVQSEHLQRFKEEFSGWGSAVCNRRSETGETVFGGNQEESKREHRSLLRSEPVFCSWRHGWYLSKSCSCGAFNAAASSSFVHMHLRRDQTPEDRFDNEADWTVQYTEVHTMGHTVWKWSTH